MTSAAGAWPLPSVWAARLRRGQHHLGFVHKHIEARGVEEIDFRLIPLGVGHAGRDGHLAGDFFVVVVGRRGAVINAAEPLGRPRGIKHGRDQRGFARLAVPDQNHVTYVCAVVNFHGLTPSDSGFLEGSWRE